MRLVRQIRFFFKLTLDLIASRLGLLRTPFKYILVVTKSCNSRCKNCLIWTETVQNELSLEECGRIAKASPRLKWLNLTGGEITLRDDLVEIVKAFKFNCRDLEILNFTTNGIDAEKITDVVSQLKALDFLKFTVNVSLDGDQSTHDRLRGVKGNFESALRTYRCLKQIGVDGFLSFTVYDSNYKSVESMLSEIQAIDPAITLHDFHFTTENLSTHFYGNTKLKTSLENDAAKNDAKAALFHSVSRQSRNRPNSFLNFGEILRRRYHRLAVRYLATGKTPIKCQSLTNSVYISEIGELFPCVIWNRKLGSLRSSAYDVSSILENTSTAATKTLIKQKQCDNCWTPCEAYHSMLSRPLGF